MPSNTCAGCPNLVENRIAMNGLVYSCKHTGAVIPQNSVSKEDHWQITFWRVPLPCPRTDTVKSETKAPAKDWVVVKVPFKAKRSPNHTGRNRK
jgi:hypothetical protein